MIIGSEIFINHLVLYEKLLQALGIYHLKKECPLATWILVSVAFFCQVNLEYRLLYIQTITINNRSIYLYCVLSKFFISVSVISCSFESSANNPFERIFLTSSVIGDFYYFRLYHLWKGPCDIFLLGCSVSNVCFIRAEIVCNFN